ncbi:MAG: sulfotransferase domain-containing protein [Anaerolineales bacterium]|nr:sulfotransferase domain-containing protein [Anaerolineales bacterium]
MIVYIASYPRSGNFWLQNLFGNQFRRLTTNIHEGQNRPNMLDVWARSNKKSYDINLEALGGEAAAQYGDLSNWMVRYKSLEEPDYHLGILPGCLDVLNTEKTRKLLADDKEYYFLKTHFLPYSNYFEGEYVLQIVRHPGACLWSYYNFKRDLLKQYDQDLDSVIRGEVIYEALDDNWSRYHAQWTQAGAALKSNYMLARYEDLFGKEIEFCERVESFLNLPIMSRELRSFEFYHEFRPTLTREGKATGWEKNYSKKQLELLWKSHGEAAKKFGYQEPNYELGADTALY